MRSNYRVNFPALAKSSLDLRVKGPKNDCEDKGDDGGKENHPVDGNMRRPVFAMNV